MDDMKTANEERKPAEVEKKRGRGHFFCEKAPLLVMVIGAVFLVLFYPLVGNVAGGLLRMAVPSLNTDIADNLLVAASRSCSSGCSGGGFPPITGARFGFMSR